MIEYDKEDTDGWKCEIVNTGTNKCVESNKKKDVK